MQKYRQNLTLDINTEKNKIIMYSYDSKICELKNNKVVKVYKNFDYSRTTTKHLNYFLNEFCLNAKNKKDIENLIKKGAVMYE